MSRSTDQVSRDPSSRAEGTADTAAPEPRVGSRDLPANIVRVKRSPFLYLYVPTSSGSRRRIGTRIPDDVRGRKLAQAVLHRLEELQRDATRRRALDLLHDRKIGLFPDDRRWPDRPGLNDVLAGRGPAGVDELLAKIDADECDIDLALLIAEFAADPVSLHTRKRGQVMKSDARANDAAHVSAVLDWCALDESQGAEGWATLAAIEDPKACAAEYRVRIKTLPPVRRLSLLTTDRVRRYLDGVLARERAKKPGHDTAGRAARRKHQLAIRTFARWLAVRKGLQWVVDPTVDVILETTPAGRVLHLERWEIELLAATLDELAPPHGDFCRIQHGTGLDTSDVARLQVRDVDLTERRIRGLSGKTFNRRRRVLVLDWAWSAVERRVANKRPTDRLFEGLPPDRHAHSKAMQTVRVHLVGLGHLQFALYQARDARHSVAVMMLAAGVPVKAVARQLGHDPATLLRTYAEWVPDAADEALWREMIAARDERKKAEAHGQVATTD